MTRAIERTPTHLRVKSARIDAGVLNEGERAVLAALREIAYGEVEVVVHGARIVQITRSQKLRVDGR